MVSKWFAHRRSELARTAQPLGLPLGQRLPPSPQPPQPPPSPGEAAPARQSVHTEVRVDRGNGLRKAKTIITIRRSSAAPASGTASPKKPLSAASSPAKSERRVASARTPRAAARSVLGLPATLAKSLPAAVKPVVSRRVSSPGPSRAPPGRGSSSSEAPASPSPAHPAAHASSLGNEDFEVSFGIEVPVSPSSTLRHLPEHILDSASSLPCSAIERSASMTSIETTATAVDDGLSPWGLPKLLDPFDDEERHELGLDAGPAADFDFEAELAHMDSEFQLASDTYAVKLAHQKDQLRRAKAVVLAVRLLAQHRLRAKEAESRKQRAEALRSTPSLFSRSAAVVSSFGAWI